MVAARHLLSKLATLRAWTVLGVFVDLLLARDFISGRWYSFAVQTFVVRGAVTVAALVADEDVAILAVVDLARVAFRPDASTVPKFVGYISSEHVVVARCGVSV